jgi:hypothetical protein
MARYKTKWILGENNRILKEGYGQGVGAEYMPLISIYDFPSLVKVFED